MAIQYRPTSGGLAAPARRYISPFEAFVTGSEQARQTLEAVSTDRYRREGLAIERARASEEATYHRNQETIQRLGLKQQMYETWNRSELAKWLHSNVNATAGAQIESAEKIAGMQDETDRYRISTNAFVGLEGIRLGRDELGLRRDEYEYFKEPRRDVMDAQADQYRGYGKQARATAKRIDQETEHTAEYHEDQKTWQLRRDEMARTLINPSPSMHEFQEARTEDMDWIRIPGTNIGLYPRSIPIVREFLGSGTKRQTEVISKGLDELVNLALDDNGALLETETGRAQVQTKLMGLKTMLAEAGLVKLDPETKQIRPNTFGLSWGTLLGGSGLDISKGLLFSGKMKDAEGNVLSNEQEKELTQLIGRINALENQTGIFGYNFMRGPITPYPQPSPYSGPARPIDYWGRYPYGPPQQTQ